VEVTSDGVSIEDIRIKDDDVVEYFSENEEHAPEELLRLSLRMGGFKSAPVGDIERC